MSSDFWWAIHFTPVTASREFVTQSLFAAGCLGIWEKDHEFVAYFSPVKYEQICLLTAQLLPRLTAPVRVTRQSREDWLENWKENFLPTPLTANWTVIPSWWPADPAVQQIIIHPGMAFGTGSHETTRLAAGLLEKILVPGHTVLDVGTGSGVLAILAHKLGAGQIVAVDIDEEALANCRENCYLNGCDQAIVCSKGPIAGIAPTFDLVIANIIAPTLLELASRLTARLKPNGCLILSGILVEQLSQVRQTYEQYGLQISEPLIDGEWGAFHVVHQDRPPPVL